MRTATRLLPAVLILAGFFLIKVYLHRLPVADVFHGSNFKSLLGTEDDASMEVDKAVDLPPTSASDGGRIEATATVHSEVSATTTVEQASATGTSSNSLDQIVVIGKLQSEDTSWVEKLPTLVFSAPWILPCNKLTRITDGRMPCIQSTTIPGLYILQKTKGARPMSISRSL